jgi:catechol 2,3-dioxygenase-like lactoylglutathione lyase family enzyme
VSPREQLMVEVYVRNLQASSSFYRRVGFELVRDEGTFMELKWARVLYARKERADAPPPLPPPVGTLRIMVPNVEAYWHLAQDMAVPVLWPIANQAYGLRDSAIARPDGERAVLCDPPH